VKSDLTTHMTDRISTLVDERTETLRRQNEQIRDEIKSDLMQEINRQVGRFNLNSH